MPETTDRSWRPIDPPSDRPATAARPSRCPDDEQVDPDATPATAGPKCRACIDQGIPGECTDLAHQVASDVQASDWTAHAGRSNSSPEFLAIAAEIEDIIRASAHTLISGRAELTARTILATLAHGHGLRPGDARLSGAVRAAEPHVAGRAEQLVAEGRRRRLEAERVLHRGVDGLSVDSIRAVVVALDNAGMLDRALPAAPPADLREAIVTVIDRHEVVWVDHDTGWECGCNEHGDCTLMPTRADAVHHIADAVLPVVQAHVAAAVQQARAAAEVAIDDVDSHQQDPERPAPADWRAGWHGACTAMRAALAEHLPGDDEPEEIAELRRAFEAAIRCGGPLPYLSTEHPDRIREQARAEGAAGALRDAADAYEALSRNVLAATAFADQHYRAGGPTVPTLWLRHRADEVAAGGEQR